MDCSVYAQMTVACKFQPHHCRYDGEHDEEQRISPESRFHITVQERMNKSLASAAGAVESGDTMEYTFRHNPG